MSFTLLLNLIQYVLAFLAFLTGAYMTYRAITSEQERKAYQTRFLTQYKEQKQSVQSNQSVSKLQGKFQMADFPITVFQYYMFHWLLLIVAALYYLAFPLVTETITIMNLILFLLIIYILTPFFKFSGIHLFLNGLVKKKQKQRTQELFTLFDILKTDFQSMDTNKEVNIYNTLKEIMPMFEHINGTISRFLSYWKTAPEHSRHVFEKEIGGDSARVLGDILFKLDETSGKEALILLEGESEIFSYDHYEKELQSGIRRKNGYFVFFSVAVLFCVAWLITLVASIFQISLFSTPL